MLYFFDGQMYCSDASSTAFGFPLVDAKLSKGPNREPYVTVPFDGTKYNLQNGAVVEWCPKNNPFRAILGSLKSANDAKPLPVFDTVLTDEEEVFVKLV